MIRPMTEADFWRQPSAELFAELSSSKDGLTSDGATSRLWRYGSNDAAAPKRASAWLRFIRRFANPLILVLLLASGLSAATGDVASFIIVVAIVLLSVLLDFVQESRAQSAVDALREQVAASSFVELQIALGWFSSIPDPHVEAGQHGDEPPRPGLQPQTRHCHPGCRPLDGGDQGLKPYRRTALPSHLNLPQADHTASAFSHDLHPLQPFPCVDGDGGSCPTAGIPFRIWVPWTKNCRRR
jgi:hypothetical protein